MTKATIRLLLIVLACIWGITGTAQEKKTIAGVVKDSAGNALPGVSISEKGTSTATITDINGSFRIPVSSAKPVLVFSSIGFDKKEVVVGNNTTLNVSLSGETVSLEGVVVVAMGIKKDQRKLGYASTQVSGKDIIQSAPTNFASALYGKAPGVAITTNPGGATSAVGIQIRGISSINGQGQPLLVVDGVVTRNGGANNEGYWSGNQRLNGNGLLDINPENIESINILKGAAASALYGSDANFGVIVITTKNGKGRKGLGVDVNLSANMEQVSVTPDLQTTYGPGYDRETNKSAFGADDAGWLHTKVNNQDVKYPIFRAYGQFGPKVDGSQVYWWDGQMREYKSQPNNWKEFYRTGHSEIANIALSNSSDKMSYRFSYTRNDYKGIQIGGKQEKNTFNFNSTYKIAPKLSLDLVASYINEKVHNRPRQLYYVTNNFGGFFSPVDYMDVYFDKYHTSRGYKWVDWNSTQDLGERLKYNIRAKDFLDFLWNQLANSFDETTNRFLVSATLNYNIAKGLTFRGRYGTDYTGYFAETKERTTQPVAYGTTGRYATNTNRLVFNYGDVMLSYDRQIVPDLKGTVSVGYQGRREEYRYNEASTKDGITQDTWFSLNASSGIPTGKATTNTLVKDGAFGILNLEYKDFLFVEGTLRRERSSSLIPSKNTFYYPGVSGAFELSNAVKLPAFVSYSKLRGSWGVVGNPPGVYQGNITYLNNPPQGSVEGVPILYPQQSNFGNRELKNETKNEFEFGWENKFLHNRAGFDLTYYNSTVHDQIISLSLPASVGATSQYVNVGDMRNYGVELGIYGTPVKTKDLAWDMRLNIAFNRNKLISLMPGLDKLQSASLDNNSLLVISTPGHTAGDLYAYQRSVDSKGNYIVNDDGYYDINYKEQSKVGNLQPKAVGGFINTFNYKNFSLNVVVDFRFGGQIVSQSNLYGKGAGMFKSTLQYRDTENGGLSYYTDGTGKNIQVANDVTKGPNSETVYHDGVILKGVTKDGKENTKILDAANYYLNTYSWGSFAGAGNYTTYSDAVFDNNYIKMREVTLSYMFPKKIAGFIKAQNMTFSVYGRNLFYFHKTLPNYDPEEGVGTDWLSQGTSLGQGNAATRSMGASLRVTF
ncbi:MULTISPECIES: SusC/RagA family TonB-linked outer membrane protein [Niastella]|uniref:SusC/RagA family TonB-linked outer membrane protein n=1 Tax=Niastella soli TaxID=2821487 RepID=A0ABS3YRZ0_9BACT|nr:SusC/RagA family TonB-linked outer membrane protein [Niastella soli]MBO9200676.1 SusC/RagA family TonB-linked outer membrane protein [Niastella soli]